MYIDSHAHFDLTLEDGSITEDILMDQTRAGSIDRAVQVSIDTASSRWSRGFAKRHAEKGILFTVGIHPSSPADDIELNDLNSLAEEIMSSEDSKLLFGIGECGLDFYRKRQPADIQERSFRYQIELANRLGLPVIVHSREAMEQTLAILRESCKTAGIMHCFPGDRNDARNVLDLGFYLSFAGNVSYRNAADIQASAAFIPLDRLLVETDAPFLTPVPLRGKKNRPEYVVHTYRFIAGLRGEPVDRIAGAVYDNFMELANHEAKKVQI
jgi:TatD DNase family protein